MRRPSFRRRGYTLIELMTVLSVLLVLLAIGVPSFARLIDSQRLVGAANEFLSAVHLTRSEAIHRGGRVDLAANNGDWRQGWVVFVDRNGDGRPGQEDDILLRRGRLPAGMEVASALTDGAYLAYDGSGRSRTRASAHQPQFGTLRFSLHGQGRNLVLNMLGRPRICAPRTERDSC